MIGRHYKTLTAPECAGVGVRAPTSTRHSTVVKRDSVLILLGDTLTKGEQSLVNRGMSDHVLDTRQRNQVALREDLIAAVEQHTGRHLIAFMSSNHIDPDLAAEVFVLEPLRTNGAT
jgi:uncharacterized protein YbcI